MPEPNRPRHSPHSEASELALVKKDTLHALSIWVVLEFFSFVLLPSFQLVNDNKYLNWLLISVPLGLAGSALVGISSEFLNQCQEKLRFHHNRRLISWIAQAGSWVGLAGVGFPLVIAGVELWYGFSAREL